MEVLRIKLEENQRLIESLEIESLVHKPAVQICQTRTANNHQPILQFNNIPSLFVLNAEWSIIYLSVRKKRIDCRRKLKCEERSYLGMVSQPSATHSKMVQKAQLQMMILVALCALLLESRRGIVIRQKNASLRMCSYPCNIIAWIRTHLWCHAILLHEYEHILGEAFSPDFSPRIPDFSPF
jgi:hypothetical protein